MWTAGFTDVFEDDWPSVDVYEANSPGTVDVADPQPLRISGSLAMAEFSVKSFALFMW